MQSVFLSILLSISCLKDNDIPIIEPPTKNINKNIATSFLVKEETYSSNFERNGLLLNMGKKIIVTQY